MADTLLRCSDISVSFGGVKALAGVSCGLEQGRITAIIGPNGAGKTTLLNVITGMVSSEGGVILLRGGKAVSAGQGKGDTPSRNGEEWEDMGLLPPFRRAMRGIMRTFQNLEIFTNMSVLENVMAGRHRKGGYSVADAFFKTPRYRREEREAEAAALRALEFVGLADMAHMPAGEMAYGSQRLLEIARVVAAEPVLLLLDEPAAGLNMRETQQLGALIRRVRDELGITVALVEHDMELVMDISDHIVVLCFGEVLATGTPLEIQRNPAVIAAYLGDDEDDGGAGGACGGGDAVAAGNVGNAGSGRDHASLNAQTGTGGN